MSVCQVNLFQEVPAFVSMFWVAFHLLSYYEDAWGTSVQKPVCMHSFHLKSTCFFQFSALICSSTCVLSFPASSNTSLVLLNFSAGILQFLSWSVSVRQYTSLHPVTGCGFPSSGGSFGSSSHGILTVSFLSLAQWMLSSVASQTLPLFGIFLPCDAMSVNWLGTL